MELPELNGALQRPLSPEQVDEQRAIEAWVRNQQADQQRFDDILNAANAVQRSKALAAAIRAQGSKA